MRLGVDYGSARIGVARSDPGGLLASPLTTVPRGPGDIEAWPAWPPSRRPSRSSSGCPPACPGARAPRPPRPGRSPPRWPAGWIRCRCGWWTSGSPRCWPTTHCARAGRARGPGGQSWTRPRPRCCCRGRWTPSAPPARRPGELVLPSPGARVSRHSRRGTQGEQDWEPGNYPPGATAAHGAGQPDPEPMAPERWERRSWDSGSYDGGTRPRPSTWDEQSWDDEQPWDQQPPGTRSSPGAGCPRRNTRPGRCRPLPQSDYDWRDPGGEPLAPAAAAPGVPARRAGPRAGAAGLPGGLPGRPAAVPGGPGGLPVRAVPGVPRRAGGLRLRAGPSRRAGGLRRRAGRLPG